MPKKTTKPKPTLHELSMACCVAERMVREAREHFATHPCDATESAWAALSKHISKTYNEYRLAVPAASQNPAKK